MSDRVLYLIGSAAPPVRDLGTLITQLHGEGWRTCVYVTPAAASWVNTEHLAEQTGYPVIHSPQPETSTRFPVPELILVCPATFNTINKWAAGISDNPAIGVLNEAFGFTTPTYVMPYVKNTLAAHPAFSVSLSKLEEWGINVLPNELIRPASKTDPFLWKNLVRALPSMN